MPRRVAKDVLIPVPSSGRETVSDSAACSVPPCLLARRLCSDQIRKMAVVMRFWRALLRRRRRLAQRPACWLARVRRFPDGSGQRRRHSALLLHAELQGAGRHPVTLTVRRLHGRFGHLSRVGGDLQSTRGLGKPPPGGSGGPSRGQLSPARGTRSCSRAHSTYAGRARTSREGKECGWRLFVPQSRRLRRLCASPSGF